MRMNKFINIIQGILVFPLNLLRGIGIVLAVFYRLPAEAKSKFFVGMWTMIFIIGAPIIYIKGVYDDKKTDKKKKTKRSYVLSATTYSWWSQCRICYIRLD